MAEPALTGPDGQTDMQKILQQMLLPATGSAPINTTLVSQSLEAIVDATLPSRDDVAAQTLAGTSLDAARPPPTDPRIVFADTLLQSKIVTGSAGTDAVTVLRDVLIQVTHRAQSLVPLVLTALAQIVRLTNYHALARETTSRLIEALLVPPAPLLQTPPDTSDTAPSASAPLSAIALVLNQLDAAKATRDSSSDAATLAAFDFITALFEFEHGKYAAVLAPLLPWSQPNFLRLGLMRRRHFASEKAVSEAKKKAKDRITPVAGMDDAALRGYDPSSITPAHPDVRSRFVQFVLATFAATPLDLPILAASVAVPSWGSASSGKRKRKRTGPSEDQAGQTSNNADLAVVSNIRSGSYKPAVLSLANEALGTLLQGLPHDPAWLIARVLQDLHDHVLAPADAIIYADRLPRRVLMASLGSQVALDSFLSLYGRRDIPLKDEASLDVRLDRSKVADARRRRRVAKGGPAYEQGEVVPQPIPGMPSIADQVHALLLALTTIPGRGMVFIDDGWYSRQNSRSSIATENDADAFDDEDMLATTFEQGSTVRAKAPATSELYNPVLLRLLRSLTPGKLPRHALLARAILAASPQLVPAYLLKSGPAHVTATPVRPVGMTDVGNEGGVSSAWLASTSFVGQVLTQPIPIPLDGDGHIRAHPPPLSVVLAALLPSPPLERSVLLRALTAPDRLAQLSTLRLLLAALERLRRFAILCERAHDTLSDAATWEATWAAVRTAAVKALPDLPSLIGLLQKVEGSLAQNVLLTDSVVSCLALYGSALNRAHRINTSTPHLTAQCRLDTGRLLRLQTLVPLLEPGTALPGSEAEASFVPLVALHVLQTIQSGWLADQFHSTPGASFDLLSDSPGGSPYLVVLLRLWLSGRSRQVQQSAEEVLDSVLGQSSLFALTPDEWKAWLYALRPESDASVTVDADDIDIMPPAAGSPFGLEEVLAMVHECASRASKLYHKYLDMSQALATAEQPQSAGNAPVSPLLVAFAEQFAIRARKGILRDRPLGRVASFLARLLMGIRASGAAASSAVSSLTTQCTEALSSAEPPAASGIIWLFSSTLTTTEARQGRLADADCQKDSFPTDDFEACSGADDVLAHLQALDRPLSSGQRCGLVRACVKYDAEAVLFELNPQQEPVPTLEHAPTVCLALVGGFFPPNLEKTRVAPFTGRIVAHTVTVAAASGCVDPGKLAALLNLLLRSSLSRLAIAACTAVQGKLRPQAWIAIARTCTPLLSDASSAEAELLAASFLDGLLHVSSAEAFALARPLLAFASSEQVVNAGHTSLDCLRQNVQPHEVLAQALNLLLESLSLTAPSATNLPCKVLRHAKALLSLPVSLLDSAVGALSLALRYAPTGLVCISSILDAAQSKPRAVWDGLLATVCLTDPSRLGTVEQWLVAAGPAQANCLELLHALVLKSSTLLPSETVDRMFVSAVRPALVEKGRSSDLAFNVAAGLIHRGLMPVSQVAQSCLDQVQQGNRNVHLAPALINLTSLLLLVAPADPHVNSLSRLLTEKIMLLLVRAFAEHKTDPQDVQPSLEAVSALVHAQSDAGLSSPSHLVLPVVEALVRCRFNSPTHSVLACSLVRSCAPAWGVAACTRLAALVIGNSRFRAVMRKGDQDVLGCRLPMALVLYYLISAGAAPANLVAALRGAYLGSLDAADRTLFSALQLVVAETSGLAGPVEGLELVSGGVNDETASPMQQLVSLDAHQLQLTCRLFPRNRRFDATDAGVSRFTTTEPLAGLLAPTSVAHEDILAKLYDPLAILSLFASTLLGQAKPRRADWIGVGSNYALGVVFCCLSSRASHVRALALGILGKVMGLVAGTTFPERELLLAPLRVLQEQVPVVCFQDAAAIPVLPLSTALFATYVLDACVSPTRGDGVGAALAHWAMQRVRTQALQCTRDGEPPVPGPIPVLRSFIDGEMEDADACAGASARVWMLELAADALAQGGEDELHSVLRRLPDTLRALWSDLAVADPAAATAVSQPSSQLYTPTTGLGQTPALYGDANRATAHAIARIWLNVVAQPVMSARGARTRLALLLYARAQQAAVPNPHVLWTTLAARTAIGLSFSPAWPSSSDAAAADGVEGQDGVPSPSDTDGALAAHLDALLYEVLCDGLLRGGAPADGLSVVLDALDVLLGRLIQRAAFTSPGQTRSPAASAASATPSLGLVLQRAVDVLRAIWPTVQPHCGSVAAARGRTQGQDQATALEDCQAFFERCLVRMRRALAGAAVQPRQSKSLDEQDTAAGAHRYTTPGALAMQRQVDELASRVAHKRAQLRAAV